MGFNIVNREMSDVKSDARVIFTCSDFGSINQADYRIAGGVPVLKDRRKAGYLSVGQVIVSKYEGSGSEFIIQVAVPIWIDGNKKELDGLFEGYFSAIRAAVKLGCKSIAFPKLPESFGFDARLSLKVASMSFNEFIGRYDIDICFALGQRDLTQIPSLIGDELSDYLADSIILEHAERYGSCIYGDSFTEAFYMIPMQDSPFYIYFNELVESKHVNKKELYIRSNLTKDSFYNIISGRVRPSKKSLLAIAVAMRLNLEETKLFLLREGYALTPYNLTDLIVRYCITHDIYDLFSIDLEMRRRHLDTLSS